MYAPAERADTHPQFQQYPQVSCGNNNIISSWNSIHLEIELTLVNVEPEPELDDACGANPAPEDVLNGGCKTLLKDPKYVSSH